MGDGNGIAKADDFRQAAESEAFEPARRIVLPKCGMAVMLRRPKVIAFSLDTYGLPVSLGLRLQGLQPNVEEMGTDELRASKLFWVKMWARMFSDPTLSLTPGPGQIHPAWLPTEDQDFLVRWAVGEVDDHNISLGRFRREPEVSGAVPDSEVLGPEAERPAVGVRREVPD